MNREISRLRMLVFAGALLFSGCYAGGALAQLEASPPAPDLYGAGTARGRVAMRMLADFDLNHDGKITRDEMKKALAQHFAKAGGGAQGLNEAQFIKAQMPFLDAEAAREFRKMDWNKDGLVSLDEYRQALRVRFDKLDRDGSSVIVCRGAPAGAGQGPRHSSGALVKFCQETDLNHDGKVTREEFDRAVAARYAAIVKGGKGMTEAQYVQSQAALFTSIEAKRFRRLSGGNPTLSLAAYSAPAFKLFDKLDKNHDGVLTADELARPVRTKSTSSPERTGSGKTGR